ncbi:MAG: single-stranded DNA-binding protein, partial [Phascolarctobacterium sp.]|nr:single-stranded DNA-binding protein [Phascolarctobacterium sp.]
MNKVQLMGRLTRDPELKATSTGKSYANFTVACDYGKDKEGKSLTNFIPCSAWDKRAEAIAKYFSKGQRILITDGMLMVRSYKDPNSGENRTYTYVDVRDFEFVETKSQSGSGRASEDSY